MIRPASCALFLAVAPAQGATLEGIPAPGRPLIVRLESAVDDAHLANPPGYHAAEPPADRVVERITVENVGSEIVRNPDVRLNGSPILPVADPLEALGVGGAADALTIYSAWKERRVHGTTGWRSNRDPLEVLRAFGATFCGDDANALAAITQSGGGEARFVWVNGHSVAEHRFPGRDWVLIDGDQNVFYPRWDNRTPASGADVLADPLLALRVKPFGRNAAWRAAEAWQNASRFESVPRRPQKVFRPKSDPVAPDWELRPGERIEIFPGVSPEDAATAREELRRDDTLLRALCRVKFFPAGRTEEIALPYPAVGRDGSPDYVAAAGERPITCQAARSQFPSLRSGDNRVEVKSGTLRVAFAIRPVNRAAVAPPRVHVEPGSAASPRFAVDAAAGGDRLWWQIAAERDFKVIVPNFDAVTAAVSPVALSALDDTFLEPGREFFFRARVRCDGVWSDWCAPVAFSVRKPPRPRIRDLRAGRNYAVRVRWNAEAEGDMLVFGSNRLDFLPEIFAAREPTKMEKGAILADRPAKNLLAVVPASRGSAVVPARAAYRLIARRGPALSVPSDLVRRPGGRPLVLQNREEKAPGALTGRDVAIEVAVP